MKVQLKLQQNVLFNITSDKETAMHVSHYFNEQKIITVLQELTALQ